MDYTKLENLENFHRALFNFEEAIKYDLFSSSNRFENSITDEDAIAEIIDIIGAMEECINTAYYHIGVYAKTKNNPPIDESFVLEAEKHHNLDKAVEIQEFIWADGVKKLIEYIDSNK
jgi:hypothetical protein